MKTSSRASSCSASKSCAKRACRSARLRCCFAQARILSTLEIELGKHGIPFRKFGGIKFAESAHIKDVLSFLRVVVNPSDTISWFRALKLLDKIGDATVEQILDYLSVERKEFRTPRAKEGLFKKLKQFPRKRATKTQLITLRKPTADRGRAEAAARRRLSAIERFYRPILQAQLTTITRAASATLSI